MVQEILTKNESETFALGEKTASLLKKGDIVAVTGDLGSGKTVFIKGLAKGLLIEEHVTSPTFTLVHSYEGPVMTLHHFDVYRISNEEELFEIGFEEYLYKDDICVIEWADLIRDLLPGSAKWVHLERVEDHTQERRITMGGLEKG